MQISEENRHRLNDETDLQDITDHIKERSGQSFPADAIVADQDVSMKAVDRLRKQQLHYQNGRPTFSKYNRIQIIYASHIFSTTQDKPLLEWCNSQKFHLLTCNEQDFNQLDGTVPHYGIIVCEDQSLAHNDVTKLAKKMDTLFSQRNKSAFKNQLFSIRP